MSEFDLTRAERVITEAIGFVRAARSTEIANSLTLATALHDRLEELDGDAYQPGSLAALDRRKAEFDSTVTALKTRLAQQMRL